MKYLVNTTKPRFCKWLIVMLFAASVFTAFSPLLRAPYLYDDTSVIENDPVIAAGESLGGAGELSVFDRLWLFPRPLRQLSHRVEYKVFGKSPLAGHAVNIVLHILAALAGGLFLLSLGVPGNVALVTALVFALNPVSVESVGIVSHRKEMLAALFTFLGLSAFLSRSRMRGALMALCFFLAVAGKETAVVFPGLLWAIACCRCRGGEERPLYRRALFWSCFALLLACFAYWQIRAGMDYMRINPSEIAYRAGHLFGVTGWKEPFATVFLAFPRYLLSFVSPVGHCIDPAPWPVSVIAVTCSVLFAVLYAALLWKARRTRCFLPLCWIPVALSPYLIPALVKSCSTATFAERYAYFALFGFAWLVAELTMLLIGRTAGLMRTAGAVLLAACLFVSSVGTYRLCLTYRTAPVFWSSVCEMNPASPQAHLNLALSFDEAVTPGERIEAEYLAMQRLAPDFVWGILEFFNFYCREGEFHKGFALLENTLKLDIPSLHKAEILRKRARYRLSCMVMTEAVWTDALKDLERAGSLGLDTPDFHNDRGEALEANLRWNEAYDEYERAGENPKYAAAAFRAQFLLADPPLRPTKRILVLGDSVPHGTSSGENGIPSATLAERLSGLMPGFDFRDATVPGSATFDLREDIGDSLSAVEGLAGCVIHCGHNDAYFGRPVREALLDLAECVVEAREAGVCPVIIGPIPVRNSPERKRELQEERLAKLDKALAAFCAEASVPFLSFRDYLGKNGIEPEAVIVPADGNHLNASGMELLAKAAAAKFEKCWVPRKARKVEF